MVITAENHLIPYPGHHYPVQPYVQDNPIANQQRRQGPIGGKTFFRRPQSEIPPPVGHFKPWQRFDRREDRKMFEKLLIGVSIPFHEI